MKRLLLIIFLCLPLISFSQIPTDGLVGYWPFNGNANDESGNGKNGYLDSRCIFVNDRLNQPLSAIDFPERYASLSIPNTQINGDFTISLWFNLLYDKTRERYLVGGDNFRFYLDADAQMITLNNEGTSVNIARSFNFNEWYHLSLVRSGTVLKVFINSINEFNRNLIGSLQNDIFIRRIFCSTSSARELFGQGDDVSFYNRALTNDEIVQLYSIGVTSSPQLCQTIYCDGENIGIGTSNTQGYRLAVAGDIITEKIKVATQTNWPDYVFQPEHQKPSLEELEQYIKTNQKLPGIPSASEAKTEGIDLGEMNRLLLEKIEELTLYVIEQEKEIEILKEQNAKIETQRMENQNQEKKLDYLMTKLKELETK